MTALLALLLVAVLSLAACGNDNQTGSGSASSTAPAQFNNADVQFARAMITHHQQAVQMAKMAYTHAANPLVKQLASDIEWLREIDKMPSGCRTGARTSPPTPPARAWTA